MMPILIQSTDPQDIIRLFIGDPQHNEHCKDWRWHVAMININPNYQEEIARRQAYKRSIGK
jgi:hypothetical protein